MKIKYITNVRLPTSRAAGYAIMKMCSEFAKAGVNTELYVPKKENNDNKQDPFDFYKIEKNFQINRIPGLDLLALTEKFGRIFYWIDIIFFLALSKLLIKVGKDDILYTRDYLVALLFSRQNVFLELHDIPRAKSLFKLSIKKAKKIFVLNNNLKNELINLDIAENKIFISPSGVDVEEFDINISKEEARKKVDLPQDKKIVLYTGHLYAWKGADVLAESSKLLPDVLFVFVGGTESELGDFMNKYGVAKNVLIKSFVSHSIIPVYLKAADILAIPNSAKEKISSRYTSPLKLFEYMSSRGPIVASDLPSIREILSNENCVFSRSDDPKSFAKSIEKILNNPDLVHAITNKSFESVKQYSWRVRVNNIIVSMKNEG